MPGTSLCSGKGEGVRGKESQSQPGYPLSTVCLAPCEVGTDICPKSEWVGEGLGVHPDSCCPVPRLEGLAGTLTSQAPAEPGPEQAGVEGQASGLLPWRPNGASQASVTRPQGPGHTGHEHAANGALAVGCERPDLCLIVSKTTRRVLQVLNHSTIQTKEPSGDL